MRKILAPVALFVFAITACASTPASTNSPTQSGKSAELHQIFADSDEAQLKLNPIGALFRGDPRYAGEFGDYITDEYIEAQRHNIETDWKRLQKIDRNKLSPQDQIAYDVFAYQLSLSRESLAPDLVALSIVRPINHFGGIHAQYPDINSGKSAAPFKTVSDYENGLKRMAGFAVYLDRCIGRMREGIKSGVVETKLTTREMIKQLDDLIAQGVDKSPFWQPIVNMDKSIGEVDRTRLTGAYRKTIGDTVVPAYKNLRAFLAKTYLPAARQGVGIVYMKGGKKLYAFLVRQETTTNLTAEEIHRIGLAEVARIKNEMDAVRKTVAFKGSLHNFFEHLRTAKEFEPKSREDLAIKYDEIAKRIDAVIEQAFVLKPKTPIELRPVPDYLEQSQAGGYYNPGAPDASRAGVFYYNTYDLPSRKIWGMETLYLHEATPGHHFQISLAQENEALPNFMRFGGNTAYVEGWALYAEWIGRELGMFKDPFQMFGHLNDEQLRALRLVVDTGIHSKGWTRTKAIKFMLDNSALSVTETTQEVDRYIANPGQALGYKVGQLTIKRLRSEAEKTMRGKFDLRRFHAEILDTGSLPMEILAAKIKRWQEAEK